jgi:ribosome maturation factor RimP
MIEVEKIRELANEKVGLGSNFIVDVSVKSGNKITILLDNDNGISISDCVEMNRYIETKLDREVEDFELNVMSPGLSEPFKILRQYQKNIGKEVSIVTKEGEKFNGKLVSVTEEEIELEYKKRESKKGKKGKTLVTKKTILKYNQIKETKIVILF